MTSNKLTLTSHAALQKIQAEGLFLATIIKSITEGNNLELRMATRNTLMPKGEPAYPKIIEQGFSLYRMKRDLGVADTIMIVSALIANLCGAFNVATNMSSEQILDYSLTLIERNLNGSYEQPSLRIEDIVVFIEQAKIGVYGRPYNYVDAALINSWLDIYAADRDRAYLEWIRYGKYEQQDTTGKPKSQMTDDDRHKMVEATINKITQSFTDRQVCDEEAEAQRRLDMIERRRRQSFNSEDDYQEYQKAIKELKSKTK